MRVLIDKRLDEEIRGEAAKAAEMVLQSYLFDHGEIAAEAIKESVVKEIAAIYSSYKIRVSWGLQSEWPSDVRKWVLNRITVELGDGKALVDIRTSVEGLLCEMPMERFVAFKMLSD